MLKKVTDHEIGAQRVAHAVVRVGGSATIPLVAVVPRRAG